jgi:hypothetical protein
MSTQNPSFVTPAKAGVQGLLDHVWISAFAGMTSSMGGISDTLFCVVVLSDDGLVFVSDEKARESLWSLSRRSDPFFTCRGTIDQVGLIDERSRFPEYVVHNLMR